MSIETLFLESSIKEFNDHKRLADATFSQLQENDLHYCAAPGSNCIAQIIQHLHGNMLSRWTNFLTEDGEKEWRHRDSEFEEHHFSKEELLEKWEQGWQVLFDTLHSLTPADLSKTITIRTKPLSVVAAINRQLAHYAYHVGQIVMLGKEIRKNEWQTLSIAKGASEKYNQQLKNRPSA